MSFHACDSQFSFETEEEIKQTLRYPTASRDNFFHLENILFEMNSSNFSEYKHCDFLTGILTRFFFSQDNSNLSSPGKGSQSKLLVFSAGENYLCQLKYIYLSFLLNCFLHITVQLDLSTVTKFKKKKKSKIILKILYIYIFFSLCT